MHGECSYISTKLDRVLYSVTVLAASYPNHNGSMHEKSSFNGVLESFNLTKRLANSKTLYNNHIN